MLPNSHPLAGVDGAYNAVYVEAEAAGRLMFYGPGAGGAPTASAVLGDLVAVARNRVAGGRGPRESAYAALPIQPMGEVLEPGITSAWTWTTGPACWPRSPPRFAEAGVSDLDGAAGGSGRRREPGGRHPQRPGCRAGRHVDRLAELDSVHQVDLRDARDGRSAMTPRARLRTSARASGGERAA